MTLAVLTAGPGTALDPGLADELTAALHAAGAGTVERVPAADLRGPARRAQDAGEPLLVCADNLVAHPSLLWALATEPAGRSTVLVVADPAGDLREERGRVLPAGGGPGGLRYAGAMCLAPADLPLLSKVADRADLLPALLEEGLLPVATPVRLLHAEQVHTGAELAGARRRRDAVDEDKARLRLAVKERDDFFTTYAVSTWSPIVTKAAARLGLSPSGVTAISVLFAVAAALAFWQASRPAMVAGAVLLYLGFVLDCVDGQLARYTRRFGAFGGWLDTMADRAKEFAVYAGLAAGAERIGLPYAWPLAITAMTVQTVRHMTDTWYGALHDEAAARPRPVPAGGVGARLSAASVRVQGDTGSVAYWLKRIVVFPIGERWALMAVLAAVTNGRTALAAVVAGGLFAFAYTLALRSLRALSMRVAVLTTVDTLYYRDDGWLVRRLLSRVRRGAPLAFAVFGVLGALALVAALLAGRPEPPAPVAVAVAGLLVLSAGLPARVPHGGPLDWLVPGALRAAEFALVVGVGVSGGVPTPVTFLLLFVLALRHYDRTARREKGAPAGRAAGDLLGWDGRVLLLVVAASAGRATLGVALLAGVVGGAFAATAVTDWRAGGRRS